jgi:serine/threonine protein kinase
MNFSHDHSCRVCPLCRLALNASESECPRDGELGVETNIGGIAADLLSRFTVIELFASGNSGTLFLADEQPTGRRGILKVLHASSSSSRSAERQRIKRDLVRQATIQHGHLSLPYVTGESDGRLWLFRPWVEGVSLRVRLRRNGGLPLAESVSIALQIAEALDGLHHAGLLHRDVKPGHVILTPQPTGLPTVTLIDAGIGIGTRPDTPSQSSSYASVEPIGAAAYTSPEQAGGKLVSFRSDLYSLGCVFYEMLTGKPPFDGANDEDILLAHQTQVAAPPSGDLPAGVVSVLTALLEKEPRKRPFSAQQLMRSLEAFCPEAPRSREVTRTFGTPSEGLALAAAVVGSSGTGAFMDASSLAFTEPSPAHGAGAANAASGASGARGTLRPKSRNPTLLGMPANYPLSKAPEQSWTAPVSVASDSEPPTTHDAAQYAAQGQDRNGPPNSSRLAAEDEPRGRKDSTQDFTGAIEILSTPPQPPAQPPSQRPGPSVSSGAGDSSLPVRSLDSIEVLFSADEDDAAASPQSGSTPQSGLVAGDSRNSTDSLREIVNAVIPGIPGISGTQRRAARAWRAAGVGLAVVAAIVAVGAWWVSGRGEAPVAVDTKISATPSADSAPATAKSLPPASQPSPEPAPTPSAAPSAQTTEEPQRAAVEPDQAPAADPLPAGEEPSAGDKEETDESARAPHIRSERSSASSKDRARASRKSGKNVKNGKNGKNGKANSDSDFGRAREQARIAYQARNYREAAQWYKKATALQPSNAGMWAGLGASRLAAGDEAGAIAAYQKATKLSPRTAGYHAALGRAYMAKGDRGKAKASLQKALSLDPSNRSAKDALAAIK